MLQGARVIRQASRPTSLQGRILVFGQVSSGGGCDSHTSAETSAGTPVEALCEVVRVTMRKPWV